MNKERFQNLIKQQADILYALTASKGEEYSRSDTDQLANFRRQGAELGVEPESIIGVYLNKHLDSIKTYIRMKTAKSVPQMSEPIEGRIDDAILYLLLLKASVVDQQEQDRRP